MGLFQKLLNKSKGGTLDNTQTDCIYAPIKGKVISLEDIGDGVFSAGMLGKGCGMIPSAEKVYAPFDGEIVMISPTKHAIGLKSNDGIELMIHVGIDTVKMEGKGFKPLIKPGDKVKCGQAIMNFSIEAIETLGYAINTAIIVTNSDDYADVSVLQQGITTNSTALMQVVK